MTVWDLLMACRRRWPIVACGILLIAGSLVWIDREPGVYWAQSDVVFLAPSSARFPNSLSTGSGSLVSMAGLIERELNVGSTAVTTSSSGVTLADQGVRDGTMIRLPNWGGQWSYNFESPVLDVQAVASTSQEVVLRIRTMQSDIEKALDLRQDQASVDQVNRIYLQMTPAIIEAKYMAGDHKRAMAIVLVVGIGAVIGVVVLADGRRRTLSGADAHSGRHLPGGRFDPKVGATLVESSTPFAGPRTHNRHVMSAGKPPSGLKRP